MNLSPRLVTSRRLAAHVMARATPLIASGLVHVLVVSAALAVGFRAAPRWRPAVQAELIVLARDVLPAEVPAPRPKPSLPVATRTTPVLAPPSPPRVSPAPPATPVDVPPPRPKPPPKADEASPAGPEAPPKIEDARSVPLPREERKVETAPAPAPTPDAASSTTVPRAEDAKRPASAEAPPRGDGGSESRGPQAEARRSGASPFGAPMPSGEERAGSGRAGAAPSSGGSPPSTAGGGGTGVAALPGTAGSPKGTGVTRSAIPRGGYQVQPVYPTSARHLGIQGTSLLRVHVAADGHVTDVVVAKSAGHTDMDQAAAAAVRQWRFEPGRRGNEPVAMWVVLPVEFRIR